MVKQQNRRNPWQFGHWLPSLAVGMALLIAGSLVKYFGGNDKAVAQLQSEVAVLQTQVANQDAQIKQLWETHKK